MNSKIILLLPALLLYAAWPVSPLNFLIFIALVPLFWLEHSIKETSKFFWILWLNLLLWNIATTWWIWNASPGGAVGAIVANSLLMCFPWMLYRFTKNKLGIISGLVAFVTYWLTWEFIHHNWDLSWPWLTLGNVFATHPDWVQWYEFTGTTGGSLWILVVNSLCFTAILKMQANAGSSQPTLYGRIILPALTAILLPLLISYLAFGSGNNATDNAGGQNNVVVVQPNVEPYTEKFTTDPFILINKMIALSESKIDSNTRLVVWPETAIPVQVWENRIMTDPYYAKVFAFARKHPQIQLLSGIDSYRNWGKANKTGFSIRTLNNGDQYEAYNTAFATDNSSRFELYHKRKLVPGVESLPAWLGFMSSIFDDLGGTTGSLGTSDSAIIFSFAGNPYKTAPIICYESIYSDYVTEYVKRGATLLTIITNDGWWGETPGYKQHMNMARLRAIENRRWIARSANTGISCFIDPQGHVIDPQPWDTPAAIKMSIPALTSLTFYAAHGDWISRVTWPLALLIIVFTAFTAMRKKYRPQTASN